MNNYNRTKTEKFTFSPKINDRFYYIFAFLIGIIILTLGSIFFVGPIVSMTGAFKGSNIEEIVDNVLKEITKYQAFLSLIPEVLGIGLICYFFRKVIIDDGKSFIKDWWKNLLIIGISGLALYLFGELFDFIYSKLNVDVSSENQETIISILKGKGKYIMIIQVAIAAPIFEEFVFRKFTFGFLDTTRIHLVFNTFIVTMIFALIHCTSEDFSKGITYIYLLNYFVLSLVLTLSYVFSKKNIYVSIIVHIINNIISLVSVLGVVNVIF